MKKTKMFNVLLAGVIAISAIYGITGGHTIIPANAKETVLIYEAKSDTKTEAEKTTIQKELSSVDDIRKQKSGIMQTAIKQSETDTHVKTEQKAEAEAEPETAPETEQETEENGSEEVSSTQDVSEYTEDEHKDKAETEVYTEEYEEYTEEYIEETTGYSQADADAEAVAYGGVTSDGTWYAYYRGNDSPGYANDDGTLSEWEYHYYIAHDWSVPGQIIMSEPARVVIDGTTYYYAFSTVVSRDTYWEDIASWATGDGGVSFQTCYGGGYLIVHYTP